MALQDLLAGLPEVGGHEEAHTAGSEACWKVLVGGGDLLELLKIRRDL